jgi:predicted lipid-binding transport protein (Tim44 family)
MEEFFDLPTIIVIGIAIFVLVRLRSVLGTRTGNERAPLQRVKSEAPATDETVVPLRPRPQAQEPVQSADAERQQRKLATEIEQYSNGNPAVAAGLKAINDADPTFGPKSFLEGAKMAYEMIVTAFAQGDKKTLKNLLDKDVYDGFERAITDREAAGHKVDFTFVGLPKIEITEAEIDKRQAQVTVRFNAEVVSATRDKAGVLLEGNADQVQQITDEWAFARNPKSRDPNWKLVATNPVG